MRNIIGEAVEEFPNELRIPFWRIRQVSEIVHSKAYYCLMMTEYRQQYRLLEFENKFQERLQAMRNHAIFTAENDDNERHVLRTMRERIELQQPVNASRLYPSLPDLREEMIERTQTDRVWENVYILFGRYFSLSPLLNVNTFAYFHVVTRFLAMTCLP